jgi:hypothetical protein
MLHSKASLLMTGDPSLSMRMLAQSPTHPCCGQKMPDQTPNITFFGRANLCFELMLQ